MKEDRDYKYVRNDDIVCPYCDHEFKDSWDISLDFEDGDKTEEECPDCDKTVVITVHRDVTYTTENKEAPDAKG